MGSNYFRREKKKIQFLTNKSNLLPQKEKKKDLETKKGVFYSFDWLVLFFSER